MERDCEWADYPYRVLQFQSTRSAWSATGQCSAIHHTDVFQSTRSAWSATTKLAAFVVVDVISIHALRMERDASSSRTR